MRKFIYIALIFMPMFTMGQVHHYDRVDSINAPYLHITTVNGEIPSCESYTCPPDGCWGACVATNPNKVQSRLVITQLGDTLYDSGEYEKKKSGLTVKLRGNNSSAKNQIKKSYKLKLEKKANLIPITDELDNTDYRDKEWVLLNNLEHTYNQLIGSEVAKLVGMPWIPRTIPVQMELNGDYLGFFYLTEAVSQNNDCRIALGNGGYLVELDPYWWNEDKYFMGPLYSKNELRWTYKEPDTDDLTVRWENVIQNQVAQFEQHISQEDAADYIDFESAAKWLLAQDMLGNSDGGGSNIYFCCKDTINPFPFTMPLLWDFEGDFKMPYSEHSQSLNMEIFRALLNNIEFQSYYESYFNANFENIINQTIEYIESFKTSQETIILDSLAHYENERWYEGVENMQPISIQLDNAIEYLTNKKSITTSIIPLVSNVKTIKYYNILGQEVIHPIHGLILSNKGEKFFIP